MQTDAIRRQLHGKCRGMRSLFRPALDRLVRNKPGVAATAPITPAGVAPARDVRLVRVGHAEGKSIERRLSVRREVENIFVAIVQETAAN